MFSKSIRVTSATLVALAVAAVATAQSATAPSFQSGAQKYKERNMTGAQGRAGGATMAARLLYAKDGQTELDATTGDWTSPTTGAGNFWKMQVSALDALGATMFTNVYNNLSTAYFQQTFGNMYPGEPFQIMGHVSSSVKRNDVITVTASVQKRPDIAVLGVIAPPRAPVGYSTKISAVLAELNGDVGAHTDCVLYVNDTEVDRANGVWVDSGDAVTCAFSTTFTATGATDIKVKAGNVDPGDWDTANNSAETNIVVSTLTPTWDLAFGEAKIYDKNNATTQRFGRFVNSTFTGGYDWLVEESNDTAGDIWNYTGAAADVAWTPTSVTANATDGVISWSASRAISGCNDFAIGLVNGRTFWTNVAGCSSLWIQAGTYSGTVTYTSSELVRTFTIAGQPPRLAYTAPAQYLYNTVQTTDVNGTTIFSGSTLTIDVQVQAGPYTFSHPLTFAMNATFSDAGDNPQTCGTANGVNYCEVSSWNRVWRQGATTFIDQ